MTRVAFFPDGRRLLTTGLNHSFEVRDAATGQVLRALRPSGARLSTDLFVAAASDGRHVALGSAGQTVELWDAETGQRLRTITPLSSLTAMALSPDGRRVATGSRPSVIKLWDAATGEELRTLNGHKQFPWNLAFSPDGRQLASVSGSEACKLWDVETGQVLRTFGMDKENTEGRWVAFSSDGRRLAVTTAATIRLWDTQSGRQLVTLQGHQGAVHALAFHPDGWRLVSGGMDRAVKIWDVKTGQELLNLRGADNQVWGVAIDPEGVRIAAVDQRQKLLLWSAEEPTPEWQRKRRTESAARLRSWQRDSGVVALEQMRWATAEWFFDRLIATETAPLRPAFTGRGLARLHLGEFEPARADLRRAWEEPGAVLQTGLQLALLCRRASDHQAHRDVIATLLKRFGATADPTLANNIAWACVRFPDAVKDFKQPRELLARAMKAQPGNATFLNTLGVLQYRSGLFKEAVATLVKSLASSQGTHDGFDLYFLAMCHARLGEAGKARDCFDRAVGWVEGQKDLSVEQRLELQEFRAEAESAIKGLPGSKK
jgi:tetratricopeptide (TPR) repeat protein